MERNQLKEFEHAGISSFALFDKEGFLIAESGKFDTDIENVSEILSSSLSRFDNDYISWRFRNRKFISFMFEKELLFVGQLTENTPVSKIVFFMDELKMTCRNFIKMA